MHVASIVAPVARARSRIKRSGGLATSARTVSHHIPIHANISRIGASTNDPWVLAQIIVIIGRMPSQRRLSRPARTSPSSAANDAPSTNAYVCGRSVQLSQPAIIAPRSANPVAMPCRLRRNACQAMIVEAPTIDRVRLSERNGTSPSRYNPYIRISLNQL